MDICKLLREKDVGAIGIGAMIVFIAMVLVAGIAASVLIQTSGKLETQAMRSGQETIAEVSSGISVFDIVGRKGDSDLGFIAITVNARAGAPDIDLNETLIILSDGQKKCILIYDGWTDVDHYAANVSGTNGSLFGTTDWEDLTNEEFGIIVIQDADNSCLQTNPIINKGDKVVLTIKCHTDCAFGREIPERTDMFGRVVPEVGSPGVIAFTTPAAYNDQIVDLQ
jgi:flagellin FlaB